MITCAILDHDRAELYPLLFIGRMAVAATKDQMVRKLRPLSHLVMISSSLVYWIYLRDDKSQTRQNIRIAFLEYIYITSSYPYNAMAEWSRRA
jgi:hypothetical protein